MPGERKLITGVLLAAGAGSRFGGDKLVHPMADGVAIAAHAARNLAEAGLEVIAVVRWGDFPLYELLEQEGCHVVMFKDAGRGMGATLAHAIGQTRSSDGWVVALADMPLIAPATVEAIAGAVRDGALIAAPVRNGERGHPVGFGAPLRDELLALTGDQGARSVVERHRDAVKLIECDDPGILYDIDRKSDIAS